MLSDHSCVNRTETVHGTFRFLFLSHLLYRICVKIFDHELVYSKSYTMTKNTGTIDRQYTEGVELYCQLLLEKISYLRKVVNRGLIEGWLLFEEIKCFVSSYNRTLISTLRSNPQS